MKYVATALCALVLSGCAQMKVVAASDSSVVVDGPDNIGQAIKMADAECAARGKSARFRYSEVVIPTRFYFDCVR
jgi:hypothetical protein